MSSGQPLSPRGRIALAMVLVAAGVLPLLAALDVGPLHLGDIHGPPWLGAAAGGVFILGGVAVLAGDRMHDHPLSYVLNFAIVACMAAIGNWIAFGPGPRECTSTVTGWFGSSSRTAGEVECRVAFGMGAVMMDGMLVHVLGTALARVLGPGDWAGRVEKCGKGVMLAAISPLLLLLLLYLLIVSVGGAALEYLKTGRWPRNEEFIARMRRRKSGDPAGPA
jgi:hypothetical protein